MAGGSGVSGRSVASKVTAILMAFRSGGTHSLSELADLTGLPTSTTHRLVGELVGQRVLERTPVGYRVGLPLRTIGAASLAQTPPLLELGLDVISGVADLTGTTVRLGVLNGLYLSVMEAAPGRRPPAEFTTDPEPAYRSAVGQAVLAFSPPAVVDALLASARDGSRVGAAPDHLRRTLALTRQTRVALRRDDYGAVRALAVPVFGTGGTVLAALGAAVADSQGGFPVVRSALLVAAGSLSRELATCRRSVIDPDADPETEVG